MVTAVGFVDRFVWLTYLDGWGVYGVRECWGRVGKCVVGCVE